MHFSSECWCMSATGTSPPARPIPFPSSSLLHSLLCSSHTEYQPWITAAQYNSRTIPSQSADGQTGKNPLLLHPSSCCFEFNASKKMRQVSSFCQCPLCSVLTEPSWVSVSRWRNVFWSAAYRLLHKNSLLAYSARDAALRMLSSCS